MSAACGRRDEAVVSTGLVREIGIDRAELTEHEVGLGVLIRLSDEFAERCVRTRSTAQRVLAEQHQESGALIELHRVRVEACPHQLLIPVFEAALRLGDEPIVVGRGEQGPQPVASEVEGPLGVGGVLARPRPKIWKPSASLALETCIRSV